MKTSAGVVAGVQAMKELSDNLKVEVEREGETAYLSPEYGSSFRLEILRLAHMSGGDADKGGIFVPLTTEETLARATAYLKWIHDHA